MPCIRPCYLKKRFFDIDGTSIIKSMIVISMIHESFFHERTYVIPFSSPFDMYSSVGSPLCKPPSYKDEE